MAAARTIEADSVDRSARIELPPRVLPMPLRRLARAAAVFGLVLLAAGAGPLVWDEAHSLLWLHILLMLAALGPFAFASLILFGRSSIEGRGRRLIIRESAGPLRYRRSFEQAAITHLQVDVLSVNLGGKDERGRPNTESIPILAASIKDEGRRVLLFGYPPAQLEHVVAELRRRTGWQAPAVHALGRS